MATIADVILSEWTAEATKRTSLSSAYIKSLQKHSDSKVARVLLPGGGARSGEAAKAAMLARMVEFGMGPGGIGTEGAYDVRKFLLGGGGKGKKHTGKNGIYVNVPFKHSAESIEAGGGEQIRKIVENKSFGHSINVAPNVTQWGRRDDKEKSRASLTGKETAHVNRIVKGNKQAKDVVGKTYTRYAHKTNPLQGLVKMGTTHSSASGKKTKTSGYMTFRRASWAGDPWMHPGIKARHIANIIRKNLPKILREQGLL